MAFLVCAIFLVASVGLGRSLHKRVIPDPMTVFFGIWFVMFALYQLEYVLHMFAEEVTRRAEILFIVGFASFFYGGLTIMLPHARKSRSVPVKKPSVRIGREQVALLYRWTRWLLVFLVAGIIFKYSILVSRYGNPFDSLGIIRADFVRGDLRFPTYLGLVTVLGNLTFLNLGILVFYTTRARVKVLIVLAFILAFLNDATIADKGSIKQALLFVFALLLLTIVQNTNIGIRNYLKYSLVLIMFLGLLSVITYLRTGGDVPLVEITALHLYADIVGNIVSFSWFADYPLPTTLPGDNTFQGVYQFANAVAETVFGTSFLTQDYSTVNLAYYADIIRFGAYNTTNHLGYYYSDFGVLGLILFSYLLGAVSCYAFARALSCGKIMDVQIAAMLMAAVVISVRGVYYGAIGFWFTILFIYIQHRMLTNTRRAKRRPVRTSLMSRSLIQTGKWQSHLGTRV